MKKRLREIKKIAADRGWASVKSTSGGHLRIEHADPRVPVVFTSSTPSDPRWRDNLIAELKRKEREGQVKNGGREDMNKQPQKDDSPPYPCGFCGKELPTKRGRASHESSCDDNPDVWENCTYCSKPCKGPRGRKIHENLCPENPKNIEEEAVGKKEPKKVVERTSHRPKVRAILRDLLRDYEKLEFSNGSKIDALENLENTIEASTDLIIETFEGESS